MEDAGERGEGPRRKCSYCGAIIGVVVWVLDGISEGPMPACAECSGRRGFRVYRTTVLDPECLPREASCAGCGIELPSRDTFPAIIWVNDGREVAGICNACRLKGRWATIATTVPDPDWRSGRPAS